MSSNVTEIRNKHDNTSSLLMWSGIIILIFLFIIIILTIWLIMKANRVSREVKNEKMIISKVKTDMKKQEAKQEEAKREEAKREEIELTENKLRREVEREEVNRAQRSVKSVEACPAHIVMVKTEKGSESSPELGFIFPDRMKRGDINNN